MIKKSEEFVREKKKNFTGPLSAAGAIGGFAAGKSPRGSITSAVLGAGVGAGVGHLLGRRKGEIKTTKDGVPIKKPDPNPKSRDDYNFRTPTAQEAEIWKGTNANPKAFEGMKVDRWAGDGHLYYLSDKKGKSYKFDNAVDIKPQRIKGDEYKEHSQPYTQGFKKEKKASFIEKRALTFGATRNLLRELKQKGVKVRRTADNSARYDATGLKPGHIPTKDPKKYRKMWNEESKSKSPYLGGPGQGLIEVGKNASNPRHSLFHEAGHALGKTKKILRGGTRYRAKEVPKEYKGVKGFIDKVKDTVKGEPKTTLKPGGLAETKRGYRGRIMAGEIDADKTALNLMKQHGAPPEAGRKYLKLRKPDHNSYMDQHWRLNPNRKARPQKGPIKELGKIRNAYNKVTQKQFKDWK